MDSKDQNEPELMADYVEPFKDSPLAAKAVAAADEQAASTRSREEESTAKLHTKMNQSIIDTMKARLEITDWTHLTPIARGTVATGPNSVDEVNSPIIRASGVDFIQASGRTMVFVAIDDDPELVGVARPAESLSQLGDGIGEIRDFMAQRAIVRIAEEDDPDDGERTVTKIETDALDAFHALVGLYLRVPSDEAD